MDLNTALLGMLPAIILIAAGLTAVTSMVLLWRFRRATRRGMAQAAGVPRPTPVPRRSGPAPGPLTIELIEDGPAAASATTAHRAYRRLASSLRGATLVYLAGGLVYALILTVPWLVIAEGGRFVLGRFLWLYVSYAWPTVLVVTLVAATARLGFVRPLAVYLAVLLAALLYVGLLNPAVSPGQLLFLWFFVNGPGTLLLLAFLNRRVRAVGPLVLTFMVAGVAGAILVSELLGVSGLLRRGLLEVVILFGLGATTAYWTALLTGFAAFGLFGWWLLGWLGRRYRAKRFSDQSLTIDSLWLLFAIVQPVGIAPAGLGWLLIGPIAFGAYKLVTLAGLAWLRRRTSTGRPGPMLLLLRVFALGRRSEQFFDSFAKWWRRAGSVSLIAGPDLVTALVEPHEFLEFVGGRLSRQFVQGQADLEQRLARLDRQPDPDGRYRVTDFFCHADTWQLTMRRLARQSDAILMDLRSFAPTNQGCLYELEQLLNLVDLRQVALLVDDTTDRPFLEQSLQRLWQQVDPASPNCRIASPTVRLFPVGRLSSRSLRRLLLALLEG